MSTASEIADLLAGRLSMISIDNGYQTDIGLRFFAGRRQLDESHVPCSVLVEGDDTPKGEQRGRVLLEVSYLLEGHAACDPDHPNVVAHQIITDLKRAIFSGDDTFDGRVAKLRYRGRQIQPREGGQATIAAGIEIALEFTELLADP